MTRIEIIIGVGNVQESSKWYQELLNCKSNHGGDTFEILADQDDTVILSLHKWGEHEHVSSSDKCNTAVSPPFFSGGYPPEKKGGETENLILCCDDKKIFPAHPGTKVSN